MPVHSVPENIEHIHIPTRVLRSMEKQNIPVLEAAKTIHYPDRVKQGNLPGRWVAERDLEGGATIRAVYTVRHRPPEPWDDEWVEIEAEVAVELAAHRSDPPSGVELKTAVVVRLVMLTDRRA